MGGGGGKRGADREGRSPNYEREGGGEKTQPLRSLEKEKRSWEEKKVDGVCDFFSLSLLSLLSLSLFLSLSSLSLSLLSLSLLSLSLSPTFR